MNDTTPDPTPDFTPTPETKRVVQAILSVFETGKAAGDYSALAVLDDGAGFSYGKHQATDRSGSLDAIVRAYINAGGEYADDLRPYLDRLKRNETTGLEPANADLRAGLGGWPEWARALATLLCAAGHDDPIMHHAQDFVFDLRYWDPAMIQVAALELRESLSVAIVYDTAIQSGFDGAGSLAAIRRHFPEMPPSSGGNERAWALAYMDARRGWLACHTNPAVASTCYRMDCLLHQAAEGNWGLETPLKLLPTFPRVEVR